MRAEPQKRAPQTRDEDAAHEIDRRIVARAARSEGIVTTAVLLDAGLSHGEIVTRVRHGWLVRRHHGVYLVGAVAGPLADEMAAVQAIGEDAGLSYGAAGALWRVRSRVDGPIDVSVAGRHARSRPGIRVHNVRTLEWTTHRGIRVTTPARTLLDLAAVVSPHHLARAATEAEIQRLTSATSLAALVARYPTRAGTKAIRKLLRTRDIGRNITKHQLELRFLGFLDAQRLPRPRINATVDLHPKPREVDCLWPDHRLVAELDGFATHGTRTAFEDDRSRDRELLVAGYRVTRITWRQLAEDEHALAQALRSLLASAPGG